MGVWKQIAALPAARNEAATAWHAGKVYVAGGILDTGFSGYSWQNSLFILDPVGNTWTTGAPLPTTGRCYAFSTASDGLHVVFIETGAHYAYDPGVNTWATRTSAPGPGRVRAYHFLDSAGRFYLAAGQALGSPPNSYKVDRYDPVANSWTALPDAPSDTPYPGEGAGTLGSDSKVYLAYDSSTKDLIVYDPATGVWSRTPAMPDTKAIWAQVSRLPSGIVLALPHLQDPPPGGVAPLMRRVDGYNPATGAWTMGVTPDFPGSNYRAAVATEPGGIVYLLGGRSNNTAGEAFATAQAWAYKQNEPPTVATLLTLTGGVLVSTAVTNRARHQFNDPNAGDSQSKADHRWRKVGDLTWLTETVVSPNPWRDFPAGTLTAGNWERQVLTYDAAGEPAPAWTPSGLFTAADPPAGPVIIDPINGSIFDQIEHVEWSTPSQESYQVRRVADNGAGAPNTAVVYFDTGEVVDTLTRKIPVTFETNNRAEHVQVRIKDGGLWSTWDSVGGTVSYTRPPKPTFTTYTDPSTGSLLIMIATPEPLPGDPAAVSTRVYITEPLPSGQVVEQRRAVDLPTNTAWRYWAPVGSWDYTGGRIRVESVAANGTTASSS